MRDVHRTLLAADLSGSADRSAPMLLPRRSDVRDVHDRRAQTASFQPLHRDGGAPLGCSRRGTRRRRCSLAMSPTRNTSGKRLPRGVRVRRHPGEVPPSTCSHFETPLRRRSLDVFAAGDTRRSAVSPLFRLFAALVAALAALVVIASVFGAAARRARDGAVESVGLGVHPPEAKEPLRPDRSPAGRRLRTRRASRCAR